MARTMFRLHTTCMNRIRIRPRHSRPHRAFAVFAFLNCQPNSFQHVNNNPQNTVAAFAVPKRRLRSIDCCTNTQSSLLQRLFSSASSSSSPTEQNQPSPYQDIQHLPRLYVETSSNDDATTTTTTTTTLTPKAVVPLTTGQAHYLLDVMRITNTKRWGRDYAGCVRIFNGKDGEWLAKVVELNNTGNSKKRRRKVNSDSEEIAADAVLECIECVIPQPAVDGVASAIPSVELYFGRLKKKQQRKWVLEKVTELGVDGITLLDTEYSMGGAADKTYNAGGDPWDYDKHKAHVVEAAEQCERLTLPMLAPNLLLWEDLIERIRGSNDPDGNVITYWLVCRERDESSPPILSVLQSIQARQGEKLDAKIVFRILVGPEGGWSPTELETFEKIQSSLDDDKQQQPPSNFQLQFVSLGSSVLRAETAAVTAVACVKMYHDAAVS